MIAFENNDWIVESYGMRATLLPGNCYSSRAADGNADISAGRHYSCPT